MKKAHHMNLLSLRCFAAFNALVAYSLISVANPAKAQSSVKFEIGESARLLEASLMLQKNEITQSEFNSIQMAETCKSPSVRLQDRNRPWMLVWNTSTSADEISTVTIDLTEPGFEFGNGDMAGDGFEGFLSLLSDRSDAGVSFASNPSFGADTTELELNFAGLTQGVAAIFRIDIDEPGGVTMFPDFREAMMGADTGSGPGSLATLKTNFTSGLATMSTFGRSGPLPNSGVAEAYHGQSMSTVTPSGIVPEPTSLMLMMAGLASFASLRRYR